MACPPFGHLSRGTRFKPWRHVNKRLKTEQRFVFEPKVPLDIHLPTRVRHDELRALPEHQRPDILGPLFEDNHPVLTDGSFRSFLSAFNKRCNFKTEETADPCIIKASRKLMRQIVPEPLPPLEWTKEMFDEWVLQFHVSKRNRLIRAIDRFQHFRQSEFASKDVFEKTELLMKRHDPEWAGRIVNASTDLHNALSGPLIAACLKRLVKCAEHNANEGKHNVTVRYAYGDTPQQFVSDLEGDGPFIEADFSSNDKLQVSDVSILEHDWAVRLGMPAWLAKCILKATKYTVQSRRFGVKARLKFQLPSGATSTTFRNCIWNSTIYCAWAFRFGIRSKCVILGDDMLARITNGRIPKRARRDYEHFARLARMKAKVHVREALVDCEFLSRRFIPTVHGHLMFPKMGKALGRFNGRANNGPVSDEAYMAGKSLSYAYEFRHYKPAMERFLQRFLACDVSIHRLDERLFSYSVREAITLLGSRSSLLQFMGACVSASDDEFVSYVHYHYGKFRSEFFADLDHLLFGDEDLPLLRAAPYLSRDIW
nr:RNA dependent RNA polymerase [Erysiphe necator associated abispo virus 2]